MRYAFRMQRRIDVQRVNCVQNVSNVPVGTLRGILSEAFGQLTQAKLLNVPVGTLVRSLEGELGEAIQCSDWNISSNVPVGTYRHCVPTGTLSLSVPVGTLEEFRSWLTAKSGELMMLTTLEAILPLPSEILEGFYG